MKKLIAAGAGLALAFTVALAQAQQLKGEYKLGVLEPLTGNLAVQGKLHLEGYEIMRDLINTRFGGVMGRKLVLVVGDAPDPTAAASEATRLATREGVKIITGTFSSILGGAPERHLLGNLLRRSALHAPRAQERVPHGDRWGGLRLVQHRVHRQVPRAAPGQKTQ